MIKESKMLTMQYENETLYFQLEIYQHGGRKAIRLFSKIDGPFATLTTNIPEVPLEENEIIIKNWSENERIVNEIRKLDYFIDTGKRVPTGYCFAEIWKIKPETLEKLLK